MPKLEIQRRIATEQDLPEMLHLFAKSMRSYEAYPYRLYWEWKHQQNPFGTSPVLLGLHDDKIVGIRAFQRWLYSYNGHLLPAFRAVDTVTAPDYQGKGIFRTLTLGLIEQLQQSELASFIFNTPNKASRPGYLKMGWELLGRAPVYVAGVPFAGWLKHKEWYKLQQNLSAFEGSNHASVSISKWIHVPKSSEYLHWRYIQYPVPDYGLFIEEYKGEQYNFFLKIRFHDYVRELRVCEVWTQGKRDWGFIARTARSLARRLGCATVSLLPEPGNSLPLLRQGFVSVQPFANIITIRDLNMGGAFESFRHLKNWAFAMGDLELF